ncbi:MAG: heterodisulfide reductase [candidate division Zixibacteria bacterium HGW-Zixibacteria-1]|nr:MAG: heterodisulfide reductase [candidate division Zixibacteria bacterium HGW-Zixibacteria-1]
MIADLPTKDGEISDKECVVANGQLIEPNLQFIRDVRKAGGDTVKSCYQCATCSVVCSLSPAEKPFPRKEMLLAQWGQTDRLMADPDIWMCFQCNDCTQKCPRGARPGDVLAAIRSYMYKKFAFPSFMGRAVASPKALPILLMVPVLILVFAILFMPKIGPNGDVLYLSSSTIDFDYFLRHSFVDALFVVGNIIIFLFASIGFVRFWKGLKSSGFQSQMSFMKALILTVKGILAHSSFYDCDTNKPRALGHLLLFYGFIGAMITTGAVFVFIFIPHYLHLLGLEQLSAFFDLPVNLPHPVKILGGLSGLALVIGGGMLIVRRWQNRDNVGANGYADYLFLYMLFLVGLTGMLSWATRLTGVPMLAYIVYFIHLVVVFFLLWYMPYSKFAHMIYRTLALVYARSIGRTAGK